MYRLTEVTLNNQKIAAGALLLITVGLGAGMVNLRTEHGYSVLIGGDHPAIRTLDEVIERFGGGLPATILWECGPSKPCEEPLGAASLEVAHGITRELVRIPAVRNVVSPSNASVVLSDHEGLTIRSFFERGALVDDHARLASIAREDPLWRDRLVSPSGRAAAIYVQPVDSDNSTNEAVVDAIFDAIAPYEEAGFEFYLNGDAPLAVVSGRELDQSTSTIIPALVLVIGLVIWTLTRSLTKAVVSLATMGVALLWTFGAMSWLGWPQDGIHQVLAPLILVVGVCDAVHLLARVPDAGGSDRDRLLAAARDVGRGCALTTLTTAAAFASFMASDLFSFYRFGAVASFGTIACLITTFSLLPLVAIAAGATSGAAATASPRWSTALSGIIRFSAERPSAIFVLSAVLVAVSAYGWGVLLKVDNDWKDTFGQKSATYEWIQFFSEHFETLSNVDVIVTLPATTTIEDPKVLAMIDDFTTRATSLEHVARSFSILDVIKRTNRALNDGAAEANTFSAERAGNAEILELASFDDPDGVAPWMTIDRQSARLSFDSDLLSYSEQRDVVRNVEQLAAELFPNDWLIQLTGASPINQAWVSAVQSTQVRSFPIAFGLVFLITAVAFGSIRYAIAAMVPTLVPVVVAMGAMGWLGFGLDVGRAMVAAVMIGIGVDDAIHFLLAYRGSLEGGASIRASVEAAIQNTGRALITTSIALALGFLTLMASAWQTISSFGFFVSLTVIAALVSTLFLLPALLLGPWNRVAQDVPETD